MLQVSEIKGLRLLHVGNKKEAINGRSALSGCRFSEDLLKLEFFHSTFFHLVCVCV